VTTNALNFIFDPVPLPPHSLYIEIYNWKEYCILYITFGTLGDALILLDKEGRGRVANTSTLVGHCIL
jgi:hypothetical protein